MNEQDSAQMQGVLSGLGYSRAADAFDADLVLINTCSIREKAVHKIYSDLGRMSQIKEDRPNMVIGIAGCVAEQEKDALTKRFPALDLVFGPDHIRKLPQMLDDLRLRRNQGQRAQAVHTGFDLRKDFRFVNVLPDAEDTPVKAFVNIQKGCDNICSFCIVPFVRGREVSRPADDIVSEIIELVDRGVQEVTLLGQNVNSYGLKTPELPSFAKLLEMIAARTKLKRLRFTTSHPKDVGDDLVEQYRDNPILSPSFHLPVQSGSDRILDLMRRQYTRADYMSIIEKFAKHAPKVCFGTDLIVGFPSETQADFEATLSLVSEVGFDATYSFAYSSRPYTKAEKLEDNVSDSEKSDRLAVLQDLCRAVALKKNLVFVGEMVDVLIEQRDDEAEKKFMGRTGTNKLVFFNAGDYRPGEQVNVKVLSAGSHSLQGE